MVRKHTRYSPCRSLTGSSFTIIDSFSFRHITHSCVLLQIVAEHRIKKGTAGRQAMLPHKADGEKKLTTGNMKVRGAEQV